MSRTYALLGAFLLLANCVFGQTASIQVNYSNFSSATCVGTPYKLPVTTQGQFNTDNSFSIQVRQSYSTTLLTTITSTLTTGRLEFSFSDANLYLSNPRVQVRIISSSPRAESEWSSEISVYSKGSISLSSLSTSDTINVYDEIRLQFKGFSNSDVRVTLSDSTKYNLYQSYNGLFQSPQIFAVGKSGMYNITHAENYCGTMETSGNFKTVVNSTALNTVSIAPQSVCENGEVKISFSTMGTALNAQTRYKVRFIQVNSGSDKPAVAEVAAQLTGNFLTAKFPATFVLSYAQDFMAQVITESPALVGSHGNVRFRVYPQANAVFSSQSLTMNIGDYTSLQFLITGLPPFTLELSDGTKQYWLYEGSNNYVNIHPSKSTSYSIKSLISGCGKKEFSNSQSVNITVRQGIRIEDEQKRQIICAGTKGRIKFSTSADLTANTKFTIRGESGSEVLIFNAVRSGEYLEFDIPQRSQGYQNFNYRIITTNPSLESQSSYYIAIQTTPTISFRQYNKYSYEIPTKVKVEYDLIGGGPFAIENTDGSITKPEYDYNYFNEFFLKQTTQFKIRSISNSCFKNDNPPSVTVSLTSSDFPAIFIEPMKAGICDSDSIEIVFGVLGKFNPENVFAIQGYSSCCTFQTLKMVNGGGKYKIKLPSTQYYSSNSMIRVASTNPVVFSESTVVSVQRPLDQLTLYPVTKPEEPYKFVASQSPLKYLTINSSNSGPPSQVIYTENGVEKTYANTELYSMNIPISPVVGKTTEYIVKKVTNQCGSLAVNLATYITSMPYNILFSDQNYSNNQTYCIGSPISIPFGLSEEISANATFSLQIWKSGSTEMTTLASGETGRLLKATIPGTLSTGTYNMRIISSDGAISQTNTVQIGTAPTANLAISGTSSTSVNVGQSVYMDVTLSGSYPTTVIFEDGSKQTYYSAAGSRSVYAQKGGEYTIKVVSNSCGYGATSGSVRLVVKPSFNASSDSYNICEGGNFSVRYSMAGDVDLSDDYIRFELIETNSNQVTVLDSTKTLSGTISLKLPGILKGSYYQIRCSVRKYSLTYNISTSITTKPDATLSGNTTINDGESTLLALKANKTSNGESRYTLSDGTKGTFYPQTGYFNYIRVSPKQTTTYTISSLLNSCGEGTKNGSVTVEVNPTSERSVSVTNWATKSGSSACTGDTINVFYTTKGTFSQGNQMTVQISDTTGRNFRSVTTLGSSTPVKAVLPADLFTGKLYRIRVAASDPNTGSGAYEVPLTASQKAHARFASESVIYDGKTNPKIVVLLEGGAPWTYTYGTDLSSQTRQTSNASDNIELFQASPSQYYKLFRISNSCGLGIIDNPSTVRVEVVTGVSEPVPAFDVTVAPNPTQDLLYLNFRQAGERNINIFDLKGTKFRQKVSRLTDENVDVKDLPSGIYLLQIESKGRIRTFKILKN